VPFEGFPSTPEVVMLARRSLMLVSLGLAACAAAASDAAPAAADAVQALVEMQVLPGTFGTIPSAVELTDGRVAFIDGKAKLVKVGDFATGTVTDLGRRADSLPANAPPDLYKFPGVLVHLAADTLAIVDFAATRTTLVGEDGSPRAIHIFAPIGGNTPVLHYDHQGNGYRIDYQAILGGNEPGTPIRPDSMAILRIKPLMGNADTVGFFGAPTYGDARFGDAIQQVAQIFSPNDFFGVLPDGSLWVARGRFNRIDWRAPDGTWTVGKPRPYTKVKVTAADKARVMEQLAARGMPTTVKVSFPFAENRPPFELSHTRADGTIWLQRPRTGETAAYVFDIWGRDGAWQRAVTFPEGVSFAGFGKTEIYGARKKGDERELVKFAIKP
jgi:hypothetical protein